MEDNDIPDYIKTKLLILGCGNVLFGDDGFGPEVAKILDKKDFDPEKAYIMDAGTSVRKVLFNITLSEVKPGKIILVDAIDKGREPGEIFEISIDDIPEIKIDDFSMHQLPTSNLLKELKDLCNVDITVFACQVEYIPEEIEPGLTKTMQAAVPKMVNLIEEKIREVD
jgi:coenzyme F420 hydrogenase subunit delta